ncbi:MAG: ABC transporter ATP-binding protein [Nanoarchaeota archaeon]|nr:ABC transporter ATP-binding protein [Nanoarchaeota archaeon]
MPDAITLKNLTKSYPTGVEALHDITLSVKAGEFFALLGPNGAGKTTTINILSGLANKTSGDVELFGKDVFTQYIEARAYLGLVPQEFNLDIWETVYRTLYYNAGYFGIPYRQRAAKIEKILRKLDLWEKRDSRIKELSGGMKRKVMIARALIHEPKILILDEPTAGVDVETRKLMWNYFKELNRQGVTILLTTHYIEEAEELCERIAIINQGKIIALDKKEKMLALHKAKVAIQKLESKKTTLEDVFLHLTKKNKMETK